MYEAYWNLKEKPFLNTPDPRFFYHTRQHEEALGRLIYAVKERLGAAMLTGIFGCGKTLLAQALLDEINNERYKICLINNPQLEYVELLRSVVRGLKTVELPEKKTELSVDYFIEVLTQILENNLRDGRETVIVIDEAHIIKDEGVLEELRLLLNFQHRDRFLLTLLLLGQPELKQRIEDNKQLEQRIAIKCHLEALDLKDTHRYIRHRMEIAGGNPDIFTDKAVKLIYGYCSGIPRRINHLCDVCLLSGFSREAKSIDEEIVKEELL